MGIKQIRIKAISIHGPEDLGKYNSRPLITYEGNIIKIKSLYLQ